MNTPIKDVVLEDLQIISTDGGCVLKMLRKDSKLLPDMKHGFGELYFSEIHQGITRAWKCHEKQIQLFAVPAGLLAIGLYDGRKNSGTFGKTHALFLGRPDNYRLLRIPPGIWYGFAGISPQPAIICNMADLPHDPSEIIRTSATGTDAPISWDCLWPQNRKY